MTNAPRMRRRLARDRLLVDGGAGVGAVVGVVVVCVY